MNSILSRSDAQIPSPLLGLPREDLDLAVQFLLCSGSVKDLAVVYGVSYPTIRTRLDRVIQRLRAVVAGKRVDPISEFLGTLVERGELSASNARQIRDVARAAIQEAQSGTRGVPETPAADA